MGLTAEQLRDGIDAVAAKEPRVADALARTGYPEPRLRDTGYKTLLRTIVGQQVSVAAAASVWTKLLDTMHEIGFRGLFQLFRAWWNLARVPLKTTHFHRQTT